ncbi:protein of unknown function [Paraburkholderia kururiensis]
MSGYLFQPYRSRTDDDGVGYFNGLLKQHIVVDSREIALVHPGGVASEQPVPQTCGLTACAKGR